LETVTSPSSPELALHAAIDVRPASGSVWVWPRAERVSEALRCSSVAQFDALVPAATHARGAERRFVFDMAEGQEVFVAGRLSEDGTRLEPAEFGPLELRDTDDPGAQGQATKVLLVSEGEPRSVLTKQVFLIASVIVGMIGCAALLTSLALSKPAFGLWSGAGALGLVFFFLLVQPLGVWLSESVLPPHRVARGGIWVRARLPQKFTSEGASSPLEAATPASSSEPALESSDRAPSF
jgi:hypothetical protein